MTQSTMPSQQLRHHRPFGVGLGYMMRLVRKGPIPDEGKETGQGGPGQQRTPARPLSAADEGITDGERDSLAGRN